MTQLLTTVRMPQKLIARRACSSSIIRLVYSVRLTQTDAVTYAVSPVGLWAYVLPLYFVSPSQIYVPGRYIEAYNKACTSLAEFTTVILAECFPIIPKFLQLLQGSNKNSAYKNSRQIYSKPFIVKGSSLAQMKPTPPRHGVPLTI